MNLVSADFNKNMEEGKAWYGGTKSGEKFRIIELPQKD